MKKTLFKYLFKMQLKMMIFSSLSAFCLILLFDFAEIGRKFPMSNIDETLFAIKLSFLRTPSTFSEILHYAYFATATFSLWNLCKSNQMTVLKSSGQSPQQILYPFVSFAIFAAAAWLFIFHPLGLSCEKMFYDKASARIGDSVETNENIWINCHKSDEMIFIRAIKKGEINGLYLFDMTNNERIFAGKVAIKNNGWILKDVTIIDGNGIRRKDTLKTQSRASQDLISLLLEPPTKQNIYSLYKIYKIQKENLVTLKLYELSLHKLLSNFVSFILFALIAAIICLPINRYKTKTSVAVKVIASAILLRFANNMLESLAHTGIISAPLACWSLVLVLLLVSVAVLIWKEA
ncbi:MAG: LptF/LptG family permease [Holosporaceae bacterium]|jgi:lipopolysaccharide export LptBFGC system permease protein LptF|nr:LptF/LptG family permease [Holosporaceae bacterium]